MTRHLSLAALLITSAALGAPPDTPKKPVADVYHATRVSEDYRWLENWEDKSVQAWSDAQNAHARSVLDKLPGVEALREKITKITAARTTSHGRLSARGGVLFAIRRQPPKQHPFLVVMPAPDQPGNARVLVDPEVLDATNATSIDWFVPSPEGKLVAVSLSKAGSESGDGSLFDVGAGRGGVVVSTRGNGG